MKKLTMIALAGTAALALAGCKRTDDDKTSAATSATTAAEPSPEPSSSEAMDEERGNDIDHGPAGDTLGGEDISHGDQ